MLSVNGRSSECRGTRGRSRIGRGQIRLIAGEVLRWYLQVLRWGLPKGGSRAKSCDDDCKSCDDDCPRVDRERSPAMMIAQGWIASEVLRWWLQVLRWGLPKGGSRAKSCNDDCPRVDRRMAKGRLRDVTKLRQIRDKNNGSSGNCEGGTAKGEECWWQQMGIVKRRFRLVVRLKAIKYYEGLLCYLSFYNLLVSDLWLDPDLMLRPLTQIS